MILGTCQATFIFPSRLKTHLFSLSSLSSFMAKGHLPSLWHGKKLLFTCLGSKLNYLIFHGYKSSSRGKRSSLNVSSIKCSIFILGTYQASFVFMSMLKTYLWFSLSSAMAKGNLSSAKQLLFWRLGSKLIYLICHLPLIWDHLPKCQVLDVDPWDMASNFCFQEQAEDSMVMTPPQVMMHQCYSMIRVGGQ